MEPKRKWGIAAGVGAAVDAILFWLWLQKKPVKLIPGPEYTVSNPPPDKGVEYATWLTLPGPPIGWPVTGLRS